VTARARDCLLVADVISWMGAAPLEADAWGVDVLVGASQKALMTGPGLAWVALGPRGQARLQEGTGAPRYYLDLRRQERQRQGRSAFTPAVDLVMAVLAALEFVQDEVGAQRFALNAARQAAAFRAALGALGLQAFPDHPSVSLSAFLVPDGMDGKSLLGRLESAYGIKAAGGQGALRGRLVRVAHMGYYDLLDTLGCVAAFERALADLGHGVEMGAGLAAAQQAALRFDEEV
jgi:aspartate aminotransferase-like enzyme